MRAAALFVGLMLIVAAHVLSSSAHDEALAERRALVAELVTAGGSARELAALEQQLGVTGRPPRARLDEALAQARTNQQRSTLEALRACVDSGCPDAARQLAALEQEHVAEVEAAWARVDAAEAHARTTSTVSLGLLIFGVATIITFGLIAPRMRRRDDAALLRAQLAARYAAPHVSADPRAR